MKPIALLIIIVMAALLLTACVQSPTVPTIEISEDGYWVINGIKTDTPATGPKGDKGDKGDSATLEIDEEGYWVINGEKTTVKAKGESGDSATIEIDEDGYWVINGEKTAVKAQGALLIMMTFLLRIWLILLFITARQWNTTYIILSTVLMIISLMP